MSYTHITATPVLITWFKAQPSTLAQHGKQEILSEISMDEFAQFSVVQASAF